MRNNYTAAQAAQAKQLRSLGWTYREIANATGIKECSVRGVLYPAEAAARVRESQKKKTRTTLSELTI